MPYDYQGVYQPEDEGPIPNYTNKRVVLRFVGGGVDQILVTRVVYDVNGKIVSLFSPDGTMWNFSTVISINSLEG